MNPIFRLMTPKRVSAIFSLFVRLAKAVACFLIFLFISQSTLAAEIDDINAAIKAKGAKWVAGETSVSRLSPEERKKLLSNGALSLAQQSGTNVQATVNAVSVQAQAAVVLPTTYDLRNINGHSYVTPVRDQGQYGTCAYFADTGAFESRILQATNTPDIDLDLAEQAMVSCGSQDWCNGMQCPPYDFIRYVGLPLETCFPYRGNGSDAPTCAQAACVDWRTSTYKAGTYIDILGSTTRDQRVDMIKNGLYQYGALSSNIRVYNDFYSYTSGIYTHVSGEYLGGHGIVIVGYNDAEQCFIAKNSWGTGWGEGGFFRIAYSEATAGDTNFGSSPVGYDAIVLPEPSFTASAPALDFGTLTAPDDASKSLSLTLTNNGTTLLTNLFLTVGNGHFSVSPANIASLDVNASAPATVTYIPSGDNKGNAHTGTLTITTGSLIRTVTLAGTTRTRPATPTNTSPTDGQKDVSLTPTLTASAFASNDGAGHEGTCWTIEDGTGTVVYKTSVNGSAFDTTNKTSLKVPSGVLSPAQTYRWYVMYRDDRLLSSNSSTATSFTTSSNPSPDPDPTPSPGGNTGTPSGDGGGGGGGCFIATAVYGADAWQVKVLEAFRDEWLMTNSPGRYMVTVYYAVSPAVSQFITHHPNFKLLVRPWVTSAACTVRYPYHVLGVLLLGIFSVVTARIRSMKKKRQTLTL